MDLALSSIPHLFRRQIHVVCPPITPSCPDCATGYVCIQISQTNDQCAYRTCVNQYDSGSTTADAGSNGGHTPSKGAIIGGVIGGVVFIAIATYLVWRFCIKNRRAAFIDTFEDELEETSEKGSYPISDVPASIHTRESIASTVMTRASNVIPIAFIPGIIDSSGGHHIPPVPPIPIPTQSPVLSPYSDRNGDTYFMPGDLRDSTYSGFSDDGASTTTGGGRSSTAGRSITNSLIRGSMASTIYPVINPIPAQTAHRARAAVVSVKPGSSNTPVPAVPRIDYDKYTRLGEQTQKPIPQTLDPPRIRNEEAFSLNAMLAAISPQPVVPPTLAAEATKAPSAAVAAAASSSTLPTEQRSTAKLAVPAHLTAVIEEATRRASRQPTHGGLGSVRRDDSPFSDEHAINEL